MRWGGSRTVAIPYDAEDSELYSILGQINGVLFTGGSIELYKDGIVHPYYKTAKKIYQYSIDKFDNQNEKWPVLGTCQGFQILSILASDDDFSILEKFKSSSENRKVDWIVHP